MALNGIQQTFWNWIDRAKDLLSTEIPTDIAQIDSRSMVAPSLQALAAVSADPASSLVQENGHRLSEVASSSDIYGIAERLSDLPEKHFDTLFDAVDVPVLEANPHREQSRQLQASLDVSVCAATDLTSNLVAMYSFENNGDDSSGHGFSLSPVGNVAYRNGVKGKAARFDGASYLIRAADPFPQQERTVSFFMRQEQFDSAIGYGIVGYGGGTCGTSFFLAFNNQDNAPNRFDLQGHCRAYRLVSPIMYVLGKWQHVAITSNNLGTKMYINGKLIAMHSTLMQTNVAGKVFVVGTISSPNGLSSDAIGLIGSLDEYKIYSRALNEFEIKTEFCAAVELGNAEFDDTSACNPLNPAAHLVAAYPFEGSGQDDSGHDHALSPVGNVVYTDGLRGRAARFDGLSYFIRGADPFPTQERSITFFLRQTLFDSSQAVMGYGGGTCESSFFIAYGGGSNVEHGHCGYNRLLTPVFSSLNVWRHIVVTSDYMGTKIYVDSEVVAMNSNIMLTDVNRKVFVIGKVPTPDGNSAYTDVSMSAGFTGLIDELEVYDASLTATQVRDRYCSVALPPSPSSLPSSIASHFPSPSPTTSGSASVRSVTDSVWKIAVGMGIPFGILLIGTGIYFIYRYKKRPVLEINPHYHAGRNLYDQEEFAQAIDQFTQSINAHEAESANAYYYRALSREQCVIRGLMNAEQRGNQLHLALIELGTYAQQSGKNITAEYSRINSLLADVQRAHVAEPDDVSINLDGDTFEAGSQAPSFEGSSVRDGFFRAPRVVPTAPPPIPEPWETFICYLTGEMMGDPVSTSAGYSYERAAIEEHLRTRGLTDPRTGERITMTLIPNVTLRNAIEAWRADQGVNDAYQTRLR